ncbi:MAG: hypothetical protein ABS46_15925 [Cytophagaceae bacterium SCN 52-12]|nr:MAG: hypothetical protein ABS46_15925 [Cytophagaceae bacterium SCN 52-12]
MKIYQANKKGYFRFLLVGAALLPVIIYFTDTRAFSEKPYMLLPLLVPVILLFWIYFSTAYKIENGFFHYQSGPLKGKIEIGKISEIRKNKTLWVGIKPAIASNGIIIKHGFDEVYISPESNDELVGDLLRINPEIIVR